MNNWRRNTHWLCKTANSTSTIQALIGHFLLDRTSPSLLSKEIARNQENKQCRTWGTTPFEKVVNNNEELKWLISNPKSFRNAVCIIEPADHVGQNNARENVRASSNIAFLCRTIADCDSILFPLWQSGMLDEDSLHHVFETSLAVIVEGGHPTAKDASSFDNQNISLDELHNVVESLILSRNNKSASQIFICIGHQLAAQAHTHLIKRAVKEIREYLPGILNSTAYQYQLIIELCNDIENVAKTLKIVKDGKIVAEGWDDPEFSVALNEAPEVGQCELKHYSHTGVHPSPSFKHLLIKHDETSDEYDGIVEQSISYEKNLNILMFHSDEVNEEAILFANWAYSSIYKILISCRREIALSKLSWLLDLRTSVEILCSTSAKGKTFTEVAATCISYVDEESKEIRRSFSFQFHPELLDDLREFHIAGAPQYSELKKDDGVRMLMRVLYESMMD